jgi:hypothetical protein
MLIRKGTTSEFSSRGDSGPSMTMVILGAAACVSIPSAAVFLVNKLTRHQTPRIKKDKKLKTRQPGATNQLQSVVGSTASDNEKEPLESQQQQIDQPAAAEERIAGFLRLLESSCLSLVDRLEDKTMGSSHNYHQDKMEIGDIEPVIDSPDPRQQEPTVSELTPEKEKVNTRVGEEEEKPSSDCSETISCLAFISPSIFRVYVGLAQDSKRFRSKLSVTVDLGRVGFAIPLSGHITDYPSIEELGQVCMLAGQQNVKLVHKIRRSYPQEGTTVYTWQYEGQDSKDKVSLSPSWPYSDDQDNESEVLSTEQNKITIEKESSTPTPDQGPLSVDTSPHADDKREEKNHPEQHDDKTVTPVTYQSTIEAAPEITLADNAFKWAVINDEISTDNKLKATDDDLEAMVATTLRTLAIMSPTTTTGSLSIDDDEKYSAPSASSYSSVWYSILKWMQLLFIVVLKAMVVFGLLTVSEKISEAYGVWPRVMDMPPSFQLTIGNNGNVGNAQRCDADDIPVACRLLQKHGF